MICRCVKNATALSCGKFCSSFFKSSSEPPRSAVAPRKARNSLSFESATEGVNGKPQAWQRGNRTSGGFPFLHKDFLNRLPAFFFGSRGAKKKAWQKRTRRKGGFAACARRPTLRAMDRRSLFEKSDIKTFISFALNRSTNQNLKKCLAQRAKHFFY